MPDILRRHALPIRAHFDRVLVLTYAMPRGVLEPLLPPPLTLDTYGESGFVAVAMVETSRFRPAFLPGFLGLRFFLTGYRIFARYTTRSGQRLRGLRILRSDTDSLLMATLGNALTHYNYTRSRIRTSFTADRYEVESKTPGGDADLHVVAFPSESAAPLPPGSPFPDVATARKFAGPLPFTFAYEPDSRIVTRIEGVRADWTPRTVRVDVRKNTFLEGRPFASAAPTLANAFYLEDVPYRWKRGVREVGEPAHRDAVSA
jgi:hypothetical protein